MTDIKETSLPGVGIRHDFETSEGRRVGVITHRSGRRDLFMYSAEDPDACGNTVHLSDDEAHALADVLGGSRVARSVGDTLQAVDGIAIDWLLVTPAWECAGHPLRDMNLRARTGVTVVAVVRDGETIPAPGPDFEVHANDTVVVVGTPQGLATASEMLAGR